MANSKVKRDDEKSTTKPSAKAGINKNDSPAKRSDQKSDNKNGNIKAK